MTVEMNTLKHHSALIISLKILFKETLSHLKPPHSRNIVVSRIGGLCCGIKENVVSRKTALMDWTDHVAH